MIQQLIPLPIRVAFATAIGTAAIIGALWALDEYGDRRVAKAKTTWDAAQKVVEAKQEQAIDDAGDKGEAARLAAQTPGALQRLRRDYCRDCQEVPDVR